METAAAHNQTELQTGVSHDSPLYSEAVFHVGAFPVTNSLINSFLVVFIVLVFGLFFKCRIRLIPRGVQNALEMVVEGMLELFDSVTHSRKRSLTFAPLVLSLFFFILLNNWLGILPGVGTIGQVVSEHGKHVFIPFFRGGTADLNTTLALAIIGVFISHVMGVITLGWWKHLNKFINVNAILEIPKKIRKDPTIILVNPVKVFVGIIEIISELAKIASLSFRLFGNIFAGEVLLVSMSSIMAFVVPIPFMFLEIIVGIIQAFIFAMLVLSYLSVNTSEEEH